MPGPVGATGGCSIVPMTNRRTLLAWAVFGPLAVLAAYTLTGVNAFVQGGRLLAAMVLLLLAEPFLRQLARPSYGIVFKVTLVLFLSWALRPLADLLGGEGSGALLALRETLYLAIWCSVLWVVYLAIRDRADLDFAIRLVDLLGIVIASSVYLALAGQSIGFTIGDVQESELGLRVFGPFGDMVTYVLLLFVFREFERGSWLRFAFYLVPFLAGRTRGALLALVIGLGFAGLLRLLPMLKRDARRRGYGRAAPLLVGSALLVGFLVFSTAGRGLLERFDRLDALGTDPSSATRMRSIALSWEIFGDNPVLGVGPGGYAAFVESEGLAWSFEDDGSAHGGGHRRFDLEYASLAQNQLAQLAAETGVVGVGVFLVWCFLALRTLDRAARSPDPHLAAFFAAAELYAIAILVGTQATCYLLDKSSIAYVLFLVAGMADRVAIGPVRVPAGASPVHVVASAHGRWSTYSSHPEPSQPHGRPARV